MGSASASSTLGKDMARRAERLVCPVRCGALRDESVPPGRMRASAKMSSHSPSIVVLKALQAFSHDLPRRGIAGHGDRLVVKLHPALRVALCEGLVRAVESARCTMKRRRSCSAVDKIGELSKALSSKTEPKRYPSPPNRRSLPIWVEP